MKLTQEQIAQIDETLVLNKVVYDDIKLELTDHIASDIEEIMANENVSFERAFVEAFKKWEEQLRTVKRWFLHFESFPKIAADKLISQSMNWLFGFTLIISVTSTFLILGITKICDSSIVTDIINKVYLLLYVIVFVLSICCRKLLNRSKIKTTYRTSFNEHSLLSIFWVGYMLFLTGFHSFFRSIINPNSYLHILGFLALTFCLVHAILTFYFLYKHFQLEKQLSKA